MAFASSMATTNGSYDVFLSFEEEDTRDTFAGHLCCNFRRKGIITFMEEEETRRGEQIDPAVLSAIRRSRILIIIFSRSYATSSRCLDELARIVECSESEGQTIIPVFYRVEPIELRERKGELGRAMEKFEERFKDNTEKMLKWRDALLKISSIFGWKFGSGYESQIIEKIAQDVSRRVGRTLLYASDECPIRMDSLLNELKSLLCNGLPEVCMIGLWGISGIAKRTIAKACYNTTFESFECSSFLENVGAASKRCNGLARLQEILLTDILGDSDNVKVANIARGINLIRERLCNKRILIVFDDVDHLDQLGALAGIHDWFGSGSRIIITTGDEHLLVAHGVNRKYEINELCDDDDVAHQHLGFPHDEICEIYKANFDALEHHEKAIFLDIACFFRGDDKDNVEKMLRHCSLYPDIGIPVLVDKSFIHIKAGKLHVNDVAQHMGRDIVRQESPNPGSCCRLWFHEDILRVFEENTGTDAIEGILVDLPKASSRVLNAKAFANMRRLRLLIVKNACFSGGPKHLPNELRWLEWSNYPSPSLPSSFRPKKLTVLKLHSGSITQLWDGFKMCLNLAIVELTKCELLREIPDVSAIPNLEKLIVNHCKSLVCVDKSVGFLLKLVVLNLEGCSNLRRAPPELRLVSLETLILSGCSNLEKFPDILESMECVECIDLSDTAVKELPSSVENLTGLRYLKLNSCRNLKALPSNIYSLQKIKDLHLKGCNRLQEFPICTSSLLNLETGFPMLESLDASSCGISSLDFLEAPNYFTKLVNLDMSRNNMLTLPSCISKFSELKFLHLEDCKQLREILELPPNLTHVNAKGCESLMRLNTSNLQSNTSFKLDFSNCHKLSQTQVAKKLLHEVTFGDNEFQVIIPGSDIPDCLSYQSSDCSMSFEVQSCVRGKLLGLIVSTTFWLKDRVSVSLKCKVSINGETAVSLASDLDDSLEFDHLWMTYFPLTHQTLEEIRDGCNQVEISFRFLEGDGNESKIVTIKGIGVRFLGMLDAEEFNGSTDIRVLFRDSCRFLKESTANTPFDSTEGVQLTKTSDDHEFRILDVDHIMPLNRSHEIPNATISKRDSDFAGKRKLCCLRQMDRHVGLAPKLTPFKITTRKKKKKNEKRRRA